MMVVDCGKLAWIKKFIHAGANVNQMNDAGVAPLEKAVCNEQTKTVQALLRAGADVNAFTEDLLYDAADNGRVEIVRLLLSHGSNVNYLNFQSCCNHCFREMFANQRLFPTNLKCKPFCSGWKCMRLLLAAGGNTSCQIKTFRGHGRFVILHADYQCFRVMLPKEDCILLPDKLNLMHICWKFIWHHLLSLNSLNLYCRVPQLGLPSVVTKYLLYNIPLEDKATNQ